MSFLLLETFPAFPIRSGTFAVFTVSLLGRFVQATSAPMCSKFRGTPAPTCEKPGFSGAGTPAQLSLPQGPLPLPGTPSAPENKKARTFRPALSAVKICEFSSFSLYPHSSLPKKARFYGRSWGARSFGLLPKEGEKRRQSLFFSQLYVILPSNRQRGKPCGRNGRPPGAPLWDGRIGGAYKGDRIP